jgi:hypothetical protein
MRVTFLCLLIIFGSLPADPGSGRVDVLLPRTGELGELGEEFLRGYLLSLKGDFEVRIWDSEGRRRKTLALVEQVALSESDLLIGPLLSANASIAVPYTDLHDLPAVLPMTADLNLGAESDRVFPFTRALREEALRLIDFVIDTLGADTVLLFYPSTALGMSLRSLFERRLVEKDAHILHSLPFSTDSFDFRPTVRMILGEDSTIVCHGAFIPIGGLAAAVLASQLGEIDPNLPVYGLEEWTDREITSLLFGLEKNILLARIEEKIEAEIERSETRSVFESEFRAKYGRLPSVAARRGYDSGQLTNVVFDGDRSSRKEARERLIHLGCLRGVSGDILLSSGKGFINIRTYDNGRIRPVRKSDYGRLVRRIEISEEGTP